MKTPALFLALAAATSVFGLEIKTSVPAVGDVRLACNAPGTWTFDCSVTKGADGADLLTVKMSSPSEAVPPAFSVSWRLPQTDVHHFWDSASTHYGIPWSEPHLSELSSGMPLYQFFDANESNRWTFACTECRRTVDFRAPIGEHDCTIGCSFNFFVRPEAPMKEYATTLRFDARRHVRYDEALQTAVAWMGAAPENGPALEAGDSAFDPLYSTWYSFHQKITADDVERECALAAPLGMKTVIVDDGWQIERHSGWSGYRYCGDWKAATRFTDDMKAHVARVQALGFKYVLWYSVPFVGEKSANFERFRPYCFPATNNCAGGWVLDPRFPEVREFLIGTYERAVRDWNLDGFKLDFIGRFTIRGEDPAVKENWRGRDIKSIPVAADLLLTEATRRLKALKPDILIEFRQPYVGPCIRKYGNMLRATDCPCSMAENRTRIARLRLTSGGSAVHGDMLEWRADETPESAARCVMNSLFGVVQYSVKLQTLPGSHREMIRHWLAFSVAHRDALLRGRFRAYQPEGDYPVLEGESASERVIGVYRDGVVAKAGSPDRTVYVLNAANVSTLTLDLARAPRSVAAFDVFGKSASAPTLKAGLNRATVPCGGYLRLEW